MKRSASVKFIIIVSILIFSIVSLTACNVARQFDVFGLISLSVQVQGSGSSKLADKIYSYIKSLESVVSPTIEGSDLWKINNAKAGESIECSDVTLEIFSIAEQAFTLSGGAYDPSVYPLVELWHFQPNGFVQGQNRDDIPTPQEIDEVKKLVGLDRAFEIDYKNKTVTKKISGAMLDFGGVAKGYAVQKALELANEKQKCLINLGGNIGGINKNYVIGIGRPDRGATDYIGTLTLYSGECISTSGDYERYYKHIDKDSEQATYYHHIIDPRTGYPSGSSSGQSEQEILRSVTVITADGGLGDALGTAIMVLGKTEGVKLLESLGSKAVLIDFYGSVEVIGDCDFALV